MNNADMPAMPVIDNEQSFPLDMERYGSKSASAQFAFGLTKREMMAMHMMSGLLASDTKASHLDFARESVKAVDALLEELERTCQKT